MQDFKKEAEEAASNYEGTPRSYKIKIELLAYEAGYIAAAEKHSPRWISVDERLPENDEWVRTYNGNMEGYALFNGFTKKFIEKVTPADWVTEYWMPASKFTLITS